MKQFCSAHLGIVAAFVVVVVALAYAGGAAPPGRSAASYTCILNGRLPGVDLHFRAADGTKLVGHRFGTGTSAVVLAHQADSTLCAWVDEAERLAAQGFTAIAFDFRGYGASQSRKAPADHALALDVAAAVKLARGLGATRVLLLGASMGGWASIIAAADSHPAVQGVVAVSAPADWYGSALTAAKRLTAPVLYISARDDTSVRAVDSQKLFAATASANKEIKIVPGVFHGTLLVDLSRPARTAIESFLHRYGPAAGTAGG
jgi:alpha-beta hydrolase superfamily lysophospholipase